jgi:hypothetical protein
MSASTDLCDLGIQLRQLDLSSKFEKTWAPMAPAPKPLPNPTLKAVTSKEPMTNGYDERDKVSDVEQLYRFSPTSSQAASVPIS